VRAIVPKLPGNTGGKHHRKWWGKLRPNRVKKERGVFCSLRRRDNTGGRDFARMYAGPGVVLVGGKFNIQREFQILKDREAR